MIITKKYDRIIDIIKVEKTIFTDEENKTWEDFGKLLNKITKTTCEDEELNEDFINLFEYYDQIDRSIKHFERED